jgi:hypothetical protein
LRERFALTEIQKPMGGKKMERPTPKSIQFAKKSAERIDGIEIKSKPKFYFEADSKSSNSFDEEFLVSLEKGEHLNDNFLSIK